MRLLIALFALAATIPAQTDAPTFKSSSTLVIVDVTIRDKAGHEITNLSKNDFVLLEDGKRQTISVFEFQRLNGGTAPPAAPAAPSITAALPQRQNIITTAGPGSFFEKASKR